MFYINFHKKYTYFTSLLLDFSAIKYFKQKAAKYNVFVGYLLQKSYYLTNILDEMLELSSRTTLLQACLPDR